MQACRIVKHLYHSLRFPYVYFGVGLFRGLSVMHAWNHVILAIFWTLDLCSNSLSTLTADQQQQSQIALWRDKANLYKLCTMTTNFTYLCFPDSTAIAITSQTFVFRTKGICVFLFFKSVKFDMKFNVTRYNYCTCVISSLRSIFFTRQACLIECQRGSDSGDNAVENMENNELKCLVGSCRTFFQVHAISNDTDASHVLSG